MKIVMIMRENLNAYLQYLTYDETFGVMDGELTCFVLISEESGETAGVVTVHVFPEYIRIDRIFIYPAFRHRRFASKLLDIIKDRPEDSGLPIICFSDGDTGLSAFLKASGFAEEDCPYSMVNGRIGNMAALPAADKLKAKYRISTISSLSKGLLEKYIQKTSYDKVLQFPEITPRLDRFSDGSIVCMENGAIRAVLLMEDFETHTRFTWLNGDDPQSLLALISIAKNELEQEYGKGYRIECLCCNERMKKAYLKIFLSPEIKHLSMFRFD